MLAPLLAACRSPATKGLFDGDPDGIVNFANWSLYIDSAGGRHPSLERFTNDTKIAVNYRQVIVDNGPFFDAIQRYLAAGEPTGWDIIVITNGTTLTSLIDLDYLVKLPSDQRPNFDRYVSDSVKGLAYDPRNTFTMPWQSGITGIAYNPKLTGRPITSIKDLFSSEFKGRVGMFADQNDLPNFALLAIGVVPETSTVDDWKEAANFLAKQRDAGLVRGFYTQGYINALSNGETAVSMAWSGDVFQQNKSGQSSGLQFAVPDEGALLWTDNMCIPKGVQHPVDAIRLMDYVYEPEIAAMIAESVAYITPVPDAKDQIQKDAAAASGDDATLLNEVAGSSLVFPTDADRSKLHTYRVFTGEEESLEWDRLFSPFTGG